MFYAIPQRNSKWRRVTSFSSQLAKAFALVGLIRRADDSIPADLVYLYLDQTCQSGVDQMLDPFLRTRENNAMLPNGIRRMVANYYEHAFWHNIEELLTLIDIDAFDGRDRLIRFYPANIRKAIGALVLPWHGTLLDYKAQIDALHSAIVAADESPEYNGYRIADDYVNREVSKRLGMAALTGEESTNLNRLYCCLTDAVYYKRKANANRNAIPNGCELQSLCNLLDIFLILLGPADVCHALSIKRVYEYAKMGEIMNGTVGRDIIREVHNEWNGKGGYHMGNVGIKAGLAYFNKFSPNAALCVGYQMQMSYLCDGPDSMQIVSQMSDPRCSTWRVPDQVLARNTNPSLEVALYMRYFFNELRDKITAISEDKPNTTNGIHLHPVEECEQCCCCR